MIVAIAVILLCSTAWLAVMGWGAVLVWRGVRGEVVDRAARCRRCGYRIISNPHRPVRCSECGANLLVPGAVRLGCRRRRPPLLGAGLVVLAGGVSLLWYVLLPGAQATPAVRKIARPVLATIRPRPPARMGARFEGDPWAARSRGATSVPVTPPMPEAVSLEYAYSPTAEELVTLERLASPPRMEVPVATWPGDDPFAWSTSTNANRVPKKLRSPVPESEWTGNGVVFLNPGWSLERLVAPESPGRSRLESTRTGVADLRISIDALDSRFSHSPIEPWRIEPAVSGEAPPRRGATVRPPRARDGR